MVYPAVHQRWNVACRLLSDAGVIEAWRSCTLTTFNRRSRHVYPAVRSYKGFEIKVQALRRAKERDEPDDGPRHFDIVVTIARSSSGESGKAEMFGVPEQEPFDSPIDATRAGIDYARDIIDNKVEGQSVDEL